MAKIDDLAEQVGAASGGIVQLAQRLDALELRLAATERHCANPQAHSAAHAELRDLCAANGITELPKRDPTGHFLPQDLNRLYARVRQQPGAQDVHGVCRAHERTVERLAMLFRHMGWAA
jgi:hypothetical protein